MEWAHAGPLHSRRAEPTMKIFVAFLTAVCLIAVPAAAAIAQPGMPPQAFWGNLTINAQPAQAGISVEARGEGVLVGGGGNPLVTAQVGLYGGELLFDPKLVVQGNIQPGTVISFYVNGQKANQTAVWQSGTTVRLDLTVTIAAGGGTGGGGGGGAGGGGSAGGGGGGAPPTTTPVSLVGLTGTLVTGSRAPRRQPRR